MDLNWLLIIVGALLVLAEIALGGFAGFDLVLIGSAFVLGGGIGMVAGSATTGYICAAALCIAYIVIGRKWVRHRVHPKSMPSNADALIGQRGLVLERIGRHDAGQVKIDGQIWRATPAAGAEDSFEAGAEVTVTGVDGVTVEVK